MKKINLNDVIGNISDELIEKVIETDNVDKLNELIKIEKEKRKLIIFKYFKYASCFVFILFATILMFNKNEEENVLIPNPIKEVSSLNELSNYLNTDLNYLSFKEINSIIIYNDECLGQINYKDNSTLRIGKSKKDVSGIYNSKHIKDIFFSDVKVKIYEINNKEYAIFTYKGYSYSYIKEQNEDISKIIKIIIEGE